MRKLQESLSGSPEPKRSRHLVQDPIRQVQQNIADWMARESQPANRAGSEQGLQAKTMSAIADMAVPERKRSCARFPLRWPYHVI